MNYAENPYESSQFTIAARADAGERADFITKTYLHLAGAILAFMALEAVLLSLPGIENLVGMMTGGMSWLIVLGAFMAVSWIAESWARSSTSLGMQYAGLGLFVVAEAIIFVPLLYFAKSFNPNAIGLAGVTTLGLFSVMTTVVFVTRKDFSFLRSALMFGGFAAFGFIICAVLFNFDIGAIFIYLMIALSCGYILYHTSNVLHHYRIGQHVAAALALFAAVALLYYYILMLFMSRD